MSGAWVFSIYAVMCIFDFGVLAGTAYLVAAHDWSPNWFWLAFLVCVSSSPSTLIRLWKEVK